MVRLLVGHRVLYIRKFSSMAHLEMPGFVFSPFSLGRRKLWLRWIKHGHSGSPKHRVLRQHLDDSEDEVFKEIAPIFYPKYQKSHRAETHLSIWDSHGASME